MKILWTNHGLARPGGTEMFTLDCVPELVRRGHHVEILTSRPGPIADELTRQGVVVHDSPENVRGPFDLIHGQHYLESLIALTAFPHLPMIYYCHGNPDRGWIEQPPLHPRCLRMITNCTNLAAHLQRTRSIPEEFVGVVVNGFDPSRFRKVRQTPEQLRKAIFFHNTLTLESPEWLAAHAACRNRGLTLDAAGTGFGQSIEHPETILPGYDLVFGFGRCALEALVSGCAVMLTGLLRSGGLLDGRDLDALVRSNFTRGHRELDASADTFIAELDSWKPGAGDSLTASLRESHTLDRTVNELESEYRQLLDRRHELEGIDEAAQARATARHLHHAWLHFANASTAAGSAERKALRAKEKLALAERDLADAKRRLKVVEKVMQRGWFRRHAWRALQRHWEKLDRDPQA